MAVKTVTVLLFALLFSAASAQAEPQTGVAPSPSSGSQVVTSVSKCFEELGPEASAEIKRNSVTPYSDCQRRLRARDVQKGAAEASPVAETPRNYVRVSEDSAPATPANKEK